MHHICAQLTNQPRTTLRIDGEPMVFPNSGDMWGTYSPGPEWVGEPITLQLFVTEPVYLTELVSEHTFQQALFMNLYRTLICNQADQQARNCLGREQNVLLCVYVLS
jgi:hypothetical protein